MYELNLKNTGVEPFLIEFKTGDKLCVKSSDYRTIKELDGVMANIKNIDENASADELQEALDKCFYIAAKIMSCNTQFKTITVDDILYKYKMEIDDIISFLNDFTNYIESIKTRKN